MKNTGKTVLALAGLVAVFGTMHAQPAHADWDDHGRDQFRAHEWREHEWREHEWRERAEREHERHEWLEHHQPYPWGYVVARPAPVYVQPPVYYPRPVYYAPQPYGFNFGVNIR